MGMNMAYLNKSTRKGKTYYSLHESYRDENGKVRTRHVKYLGTVNKLAGPKAGQVTDVRSYGDVRALLNIIDGIEMRKILNANVPKGGGVDAGRLFAILVINRLVRPVSKNSMADWFSRTALPDMLETAAEKLNSQNLSTFLDYLTDERIQRIEDALVTNAVKKFQLDTESVIFDITSTYTYGSIEGLSAYGYSRDHRPDLEQVNIGLAVTRNGYVPIMHRVFEGNVPDVVTLPSTATALRSHSDRRITLIYDRGFLSGENVKMLDALDQFDFICGAKWTKDISDVVDEARKMKLLQPLKERSQDDWLSSCQLLRDVYGKKRNILVYHSTAKERTDRETRMRRLEHIQAELEEFRSSVDRMNKDHDKLVIALHKITECMKSFFDINIVDHEAVDDITITRKNDINVDQRRLRWLDERLPLFIDSLKGKELGNQEVRQLINDELGNLRKCYNVNIERSKQRSMFTFQKDDEKVKEAEQYDGFFVLLSSNEQQMAEEVLDIYIAKDGIEKGFMTIKNPIELAPLRHWTPQRVKAHIFVCVTAYMLYSLARLILRRAGEHGSVEDALARLGDVKDYSLDGKGDRLLTKMTDEQFKFDLIFASQ
jgi:transposase